MTSQPAPATWGAPAPPAAPPMEWHAAGFWRRTGAAVIDVVILAVGLSVAAGVVGSAFSGHTTVSDNDAASLFFVAIVQALVLLGPLVYLGVSWWMGATPGMRAAGCRVVDARTGTRLSLEQILLRVAGTLLGVVSLGLGFLWVGIVPGRRGWHDRMSGTVVVHGDPVLPQWAWNGTQWVPAHPPAASTALAPVPSHTPSPPRPDRSPWTWTDVVPILALFLPAALLGQLAVVITLRAVGVGRAHHASVSLALDVVAYGAIVGVIWLFLGLRRHVRLAGVGVRRPPWPWFAAALPALMVAFVLEGILGEVGTALLPASPATQCRDIRAEYGSSLWLALIGVAVVAPVVEELLFRGVVFGWLRGRLPVPAAVVVSSLIFSAAHLGYLQWSLLLPIFGIGCVLATLYHYSRSLFPGMLVHASINTTATLVLVLGGRHC